jgi:tRNA uridine 5-carboxymethylaminomethyl modification enzyme
VVSAIGTRFYAPQVILTNGTFLNGLIHIGEKQYGGGRAGESASLGLTKVLENMGFVAGRMKTGTPPRVDGRSLDYSKMEEQKGDERPEKFSFSKETSPLTTQRSCYITHTSAEVHAVLKEGFDRSPMFNGAIDSVGPRYCPSIEDKINRFADKDSHQIFVEPEGWNTVEVYVNGFSTSLPEDIQERALRKVVGFENAKIFRPGYAIEYDFFQPTQLYKTLETRLIKGLFFAGQINGTTGYEEAACQGLMAGINAVNRLRGKDDFILARNEAYIGVLIDDLVGKGTDEPYRMFTSRAEHRILLRQDNADSRLSAKGHAIGLLPKSRLDEFHVKQSRQDSLMKFIKGLSVTMEEMNPRLEEKGLSLIDQTVKFDRILSRPQLGFVDFMDLEKLTVFLEREGVSDGDLDSVEIALKYSGYIGKEIDNANKLDRLENLKIPNGFDYSVLKSMSYEAREKLEKIKPVTIKEAKAVSGVSPADVSVLLVYMGR